MTSGFNSLPCHDEDGMIPDYIKLPNLGKSPDELRRIIPSQHQTPTAILLWYGRQAIECLSH